MELVNIFRNGCWKSKVCHKNTDDVCASELINKFVELLSEYIHIDQSEFYLVVKDKDIFILSVIGVYFDCKQ